MSPQGLLHNRIIYLFMIVSFAEISERAQAVQSPDGGTGKSNAALKKDGSDGSINAERDNVLAKEPDAVKKVNANDKVIHDENLKSDSMLIVAQEAIQRRDFSESSALYGKAADSQFKKADAHEANSKEMEKYGKELQGSCQSDQVCHEKARAILDAAEYEKVKGEGDRFTGTAYAGSSAITGARTIKVGDLDASAP